MNTILGISLIINSYFLFEKSFGEWEDNLFLGPCSFFIGGLFIGFGLASLIQGIGPIIKLLN